MMRLKRKRWLANMRCKPLDKAARLRFIFEEADKKGLNIYQCDSCHVLNSNKKKPQVCGLCLSNNISVVKERLK